MKKNKDEGLMGIMLFVGGLIFIALVLLLAFAPAEGAAEPTPIISPTGTPDGNWINPEPWPTYDYPDPYPAPEEPTPAAYPAEYHKAESKPFYLAEKGPSLADSLWAFVLDLFTH